MPDSVLQKFFNPKSIALIGATSTPGFGYGIPLFWKKHGSLEKAYLVNPKGGKLHDREVFPSLSAVRGPVDLAVIIVPAPRVRQVLEEAGEKGVKAVVIESAGFAETGEEGRKRQEELLEVARRYGMRLVGPNCVGVVNTENRFATVEFLDRSQDRLIASFSPERPGGDHKNRISTVLLMASLQVFVWQAANSGITERLWDEYSILPSLSLPHSAGRGRGMVRRAADVPAAGRTKYVHRRDAENAKGKNNNKNPDSF